MRFETSPAKTREKSKKKKPKNLDSYFLKPLMSAGAAAPAGTLKKVIMISRQKRTEYSDLDHGEVAVIARATSDSEK